MARYTIVAAQQGQGYRIEVVGANGVRHIMLGFDTEAEATSWIAADRRREQTRLALSLPDAAD